MLVYRAGEQTRIACQKQKAIVVTKKTNPFVTAVAGPCVGTLSATTAVADAHATEVVG